MSKNTTETKSDDKATTLSGNKVKVLETLAKNPKGMTRAKLAEITGINKGWAKMLGAVTKGDAAKGTLEGDGYVTSEEVEGVRGLVYTVTAAGRKAVKEAQDAAK